MRSTHYNIRSLDDELGPFSAFEVCVMMFLFFIIRPLIWIYEKVLKPGVLWILIGLGTVIVLLVIYGNAFWEWLWDELRLSNRRRRRSDRRRIREESKRRGREGRMTPDGR